MIYDISPVNNYNGNGSSTTFDFDFYIDNEKQLKVYLYDENFVKHELKYNIDYSINELRNKNGSYITFPIETSNFSVLSLNQNISLCLNLTCEQLTQYNNSSLLNLSALENSFDYLTRLIQILKRKLDLCVKVEECSSNTPQELINSLHAAASATREYLIETSQFKTQASISAQNAQNFLLQTQEIESRLGSLSDIVSNVEQKANIALDNISDDAKNAIAILSMPSTKYIDLTLGASTSTYVAPADGYFYINKMTSAAGQYVSCGNSATGIDMVVDKQGIGSWCTILMPVLKGQSCWISYTAGGAVNAFRFYYAIGSEGEV